MEEFPPNSHVAKAAVGEPVQETKTDRETLEPVVTGKVIQRKKPLGKRFMETFFGGDAKGVVGYVVADVLLPAAKDTIADAVSQGIERMLFGESRSSSRRTGSRPGGVGGFVSYNNYSRPSTRRDDPRDRERNPSRRSRASHDFDEIVLATRHEAETVIDRLYDIISKYEQATVSDLYDLVGVSSNFTDAKWGWTDMRGAGPTRVSNGYLLELPKPEPLN